MTAVAPAPALPNRIGPNSITRLAEALSAVEGANTANRLFTSVGLGRYLVDPPEDMVDERETQALHIALRAALGTQRARTLGWIAGQRTADYLLQARIPKAAQVVLKAAPPALASRLLTATMASHAWTFAGGGRFSARHGAAAVLSIAHCPMCQDQRSSEPLCDYYAGTFERLFARLVHPSARARETHCQAMGDAACRFEIRWRR